MARPKRDAAIDLGVTHELSAGLIERLACPPGQLKAFLRDREVSGLKVRVTANGAKAFVYEAKLNGKAISKTLGQPGLMTIEQAKAAARELARTVKTDKVDPRELERQQEAARIAAQAAADAEAHARAETQKLEALTVADAWARYLKDRRPHWGDRTYTDHLKMTHEGGLERKRRPGVQTVAGPLAALMPLRLVDLDGPAVEKWAAQEAASRPARLRLALRLLKAFLRWASHEPDLKSRADANAASGKKAREVAGKAKAKNDYLQREQLATWFAHVRAIQNPVIAAYLQCLLLTGARREELAELKWSDVNTQWRGLDLRDKIEGRRAVPLTPYVAHLLASLPRRNEWVFSAAASESGRLREPSIAHRQACTAAGLQGLTLHGLRRSFASLCEWLDIPGGISAQNPITLLDGMVLDGWHRYSAATELGMSCPEVDLDPATDPRDFVLAQNKARRHVTQAQLALTWQPSTRCARSWACTWRGSLWPTDATSCAAVMPTGMRGALSPFPGRCWTAKPSPA